MNFETGLALRYLRPRRGEGFISLIALFAFGGITLGVATLIIVMSVMNGFRAELIERILGIDGHIAIYKPGGVIDDYQQYRAQIAAVENVRDVVPLTESQVIVNTGKRNSGAVIRGIDPLDFSRRPLLADSVVIGSLDDFQDGKGVIIGDRLSQNLGVGVGDTVTLVSSHLSETLFGAVPRIKSFPIVAIFDIGMYQYDGHFIFMPLEWSQRFLGIPEKVQIIEIGLTQSGHIDKAIADIGAIIGDTLRMRDWRNRNVAFFNALEVERNVMFLILTLMILIAAFNIITGSIMLVKDKLRSIAILRTIGARRMAILRVFVLHGALIGISATVLGTALGVAFSLNIEEIHQWLEQALGTSLFAEEIYFLSKLPSQIAIGDVVAVNLLSLTLALLASLYPAWQASKVDPVKTLRYA